MRNLIAIMAIVVMHLAWVVAAVVLIREANRFPGSR